MKTLQAIEEDITQLEFVRTLAETHESIAALYMRRIKQLVVDSRVFYDGIRRMYEDVSSAQRKELEERRQTRPVLKKEAVVLLSVNSGLYGDIVHKTTRLFANYVSAKKPDVVIMGERGKLLFEQVLPSFPYVFFPMSDTTIAMGRVIAAAAFLERYQHVRIFYGKFESFVSQIPIQTVLGGEQGYGTAGNTAYGKTATPAAAYMFEPSLQEIAQFFETEIFTSLFHQTVQESQLAKLAARMVLLDAASTRAGNQLKGSLYLRQKLFHQRQNKRQLESVTSRLAIGL